MATRALSDSELDAVGDANLMLTAFENVGISHFMKTVLWEDGEPEYNGKRTITHIRKNLPKWLSHRPPLSLILRPCLCESDQSLTVQLDDLNEATLKRIAAYAFCATETSPSRFQAFVAISDGQSYDMRDVRRRLIHAVGADMGATGAFRIAGSFNTKEVHRRPDGSFPRIRLAMVNHRHQVTVKTLFSNGLLNPVPVVKRSKTIREINRPTARKQRSIGSRIIRRVPLYSKALAAAPLKDDGTPDRSKADLLFVKTCLFYWEPSLSREEVTTLLLKHSEKANSHADPSWYVESTIDAAIEYYS